MTLSKTLAPTLCWLLLPQGLGTVEGERALARPQLREPLATEASAGQDICPNHLAQSSLGSEEERSPLETDLPFHPRPTTPPVGAFFPNCNWLSGKESACQYRTHGFNPWVRKIPWRRIWQPTAIFLPGESCGQRSLVGYSPWGLKELDTAW